MSTGNTEKKVYPGHSDEAHPEVFNTMPPMKYPLKPGQLSEEKLQQYFRDGYIVIDSFFTPEELEPAKESINKLVDALAHKLYNGGKTKGLYEEYGFYERLTKLEEDWPGANIVMLKQGSLTPELQAVWSNERLLNLVEQILDTSDISGNPVWNLRTKTPNNDATTVPWHQDVAYLDKPSYQIHMLTGWIPLIDTNEHNGCMQMLRGGHKTGKVADHQCCWAGTWYVEMVEDDIKNKLECDPVHDIITSPVPYGGLILFNTLTPHRSLPNRSDKIHWSLDFRWQITGTDPCLHGIKGSVPLRSSTDPNMKIDWASFDNVDRHSKIHELMGLVADESEVDEFDTILQGPFMRNWEIVRENRHNSKIFQANLSKLNYVIG